AAFPASSCGRRRTPSTCSSTRSGLPSAAWTSCAPSVTTPAENAASASDGPAVPDAAPITVTVTVADALAGERVATGDAVTVRGWVRTRRDSKSGGGPSFIAVHDGSCFDPIQVVARPSALANYHDEVV